MFIRCAKCHSSVWLELHSMGRSAPEPGCDACGQSYALKCRDPETKTLELLEEARVLGIEKQIDLPGAYSILLQLMSLEQVCDVGSSGSSPAPEATLAPESAFDPAFAPAVQAGLLNPRQAFERGDREGFARRLVERHGMMLDQAYDVADNRRSLLSAIREVSEVREKAGSSIPVGVGEAAPPSVRWHGLAAALIVVILAGAATWQVLSRQAEARALAVTVDTDNAGRVVRIHGPDPQSVLKAFCEAAAGQELLEPLGLMPAPSPSATVRVGVLRAASDPGDLRAISIRRGRHDTLWSAGSGELPLVPMQAPVNARSVFQLPPVETTDTR